MSGRARLVAAGRVRAGATGPETWADGVVLPRRRRVYCFFFFLVFFTVDPAEKVRPATSGGRAVVLSFRPRRRGVRESRVPVTDFGSGATSFSFFFVLYEFSLGMSRNSTGFTVRSFSAKFY